VDRIGAGVAFGSGRSRKTGLQGIEITMGILEPIALFGLLIYAAMIVGAVVVVDMARDDGSREDGGFYGENGERCGEDREIRQS
jgi:hypothetical protein